MSHEAEQIVFAVIRDLRNCSHAPIGVILAGVRLYRKQFDAKEQDDEIAQAICSAMNQVFN